MAKGGNHVLSDPIQKKSDLPQHKLWLQPYAKERPISFLGDCAKNDSLFASSSCPDRFLLFCVLLCA